MRKIKKIVVILILVLCALLTQRQEITKWFHDAANTGKQTISEIAGNSDSGSDTSQNDSGMVSKAFSEYNIPEFLGKGIITLNDNQPYFTEVSDEYYFNMSELDELGRCGEASALVGPETITSEERGSIGMIRPSGWHTVRYDDIISDKYLYNRSHLIMYKLEGPVSNDERNLITGTRYFNATEMLSYETQVLDYIQETGATVEYHVTPIFVDDELVARGVIMQALSSDGGLCFNVFCYNVQPGIEIDYATGESWENSSIRVS